MELRMPVLSDQDVHQVALMILRMNDPAAVSDQALHKQLQKELQDLQRTEAAWGLTEGLLMHESPVVRFFGAQNAQVKISRDWETLPAELHPVLLQQLLRLTSEAASPSSPYANQNRLVLLKLFSSLTSIIIRLTPTLFPQPLLTILTTLSSQRTPRPIILEFLGTAIRDLGRAALIEPRKGQLARAINEESGLVLQTITDALTGQGGQEVEEEARKGFECLEGWVEWGLTGDQIQSLLPILYNLLSTPFLPQSLNIISDILTTSLFRDGRATKLLTEPLLEWLVGEGGRVFDRCVEEDISDSDTILALTRLLDSLFDHSGSWIAEHIEEERVQNGLLRMVLALSGWRGLAGVEESLSEQTLSWLSTLQECLSDLPTPTPEIARSFFRQALELLKRKITYPAEEEWKGLMKDEMDEWRGGRRGRGEGFVCSFYILREEQIKLLVELLTGQLNGTVPATWQDVEATIQCIKFSSEAVPLGEDQYLQHVFSQDVLAKMPDGMDDLVALAVLAMIESYEEWFKYHPNSIISVLNYIVTSLDNPRLAFLAAKVLKSICDLCRLELRQHVGAFAVLHGKVAGMQPDDQGKVIEAITSVLQALPPQEALQPVLSIVSPILAQLVQSIGAARSSPELARSTSILNLKALTACAEGLTAPEDDMFDPEPEDTAAAASAIAQARAHPELAALRSGMVDAVGMLLSLWGGDGEMGDALHQFLKAATASSSSLTLLSLSPTPIIFLLASAAQATTSAIYPSIAAVLIFRMSPPKFLRKKSSMGEENETVRRAREEREAREAQEEQEAERNVGYLAGVVGESMGRLLSSPDAMLAHPDNVESFFKFAGAVLTKYPQSFLSMTQTLQNTYIQLAVIALGSQDRFTLKGALEFLVNILNTSRHAPLLASHFEPLILHHGPSITQAILLGAGLACPRSTIPNFAELLVALVGRCPQEVVMWVQGVLGMPGFPGGKETPEAKKKLQETIARTRTPKRMREALNDFALVCRGLEGTSYGTVTS